MLIKYFREKHKLKKEKENRRKAEQEMFYRIIYSKRFPKDREIEMLGGSLTSAEIDKCIDEGFHLDMLALWQPLSSIQITNLVSKARERNYNLDDIYEHLVRNSEILSLPLDVRSQGISIREARHARAIADDGSPCSCSSPSEGTLLDGGWLEL